MHEVSVVKTLICSVSLFSARFSRVRSTNLGTITGTITDPAGAVVPNAPVEAKNVVLAPCTQQPLRPPVITPSPNYPIGTYELSVTVPGFKKYVRTGIPVKRRH